MTAAAAVFPIALAFAYMVLAQEGPPPGNRQGNLITLWGPIDVLLLVLILLGIKGSITL